MIKSDIIFTGFYGQLNAGDDAFVEVSSWGADKIWKKKKTRFLAVEKNLPRTIIPAKGYPFTFPKSYDFQRRILLKNTDYLISSGGSTIHSKIQSNNPKKIALDLKANGKNIKIGAIGVSIGPFNTLEDEKAVQEYLRNIDFIALRDQRSYDYVSSLNVPYDPINAFDLAAMLPEIYNYQETPSFAKKTIGISICPYESLNGAKNLQNEIRRNDSLSNLIRELDRKDNFHFKFFIINGNRVIGDSKLTNQIINSSGIKDFSIVDYNPNTRFLWEEINKCNTFISTRLHGAIFACFGKTPFMLVEYHQKCNDFLEDIGYDSNSRIYDADFDVKEKVNQILSWCENKDNFVNPKFLEEKKAQAKLNFDAIQPLI